MKIRSRPTGAGVIVRNATSTLLCGLLLCACGTSGPRPDGPAAGFASFVGKPIAELIAAKGTPTGRSTLPDGSVRVEYRTERTLQRPGSTSVIISPVSVGALTVPLAQTVVEPPSTLALACSVTVNTSRTGLVESWKAEGNDC